MVSQNYLEEISYGIIGCAMEVHKMLGPGLLESVYHSCLVEEFRLKGISVIDRPYVPVFYKNNFLGGKLQMDILVEYELVVELKAVEFLAPIFKAQIVSYLKLSGKHKGLLINFNSELLKDQIISVVTPSFFKLPKY